MNPAAALLDDVLAPLRPWLDDAATEDIAVNRPGEAWIRRRGSWICEAVPIDYLAAEEIAILAGSLRRQQVDRLSPLCATDLPGGQRLQICLPPAVPTGRISLTIRSPSAAITPLSQLRDKWRTDDWNRWRRYRAGRDMTALLDLFDTGDTAGFFAAAVLAKLNVLMTGATGSSKTTLSKTVLTAIDHGERLITIEDVEELVLEQPNAVRLLYSKDGLSSIDLTPERLLEASLRMRPDRILLQELREEQAAWVWLHQISSGHPGSITTIHGHDAPTAAKRLFALCKGSQQGQAFDDRTLTDLLASAVDVIVPLQSAGGVFSFGPVWFIADALRRDETLADLFRD